VTPGKYGRHESNRADAPKIDAPLNAKTIGRVQQKLATKAAITDLAENHDTRPSAPEPSLPSFSRD
jgi:hypothetical protein